MEFPNFSWGLHNSQNWLALDSGYIPIVAADVQIIADIQIKMGGG